LPELPEVQTIVNGLKKVVVGKKITDFESRDKKVVQFRPEEVVGSKILDVDRIAKLVIFNLDNQKSILVHLKMTGQFIWEKDPGMRKFSLRNRVTGGHPTEAMLEIMPHKHTRAVFTFDDESKLYFNDLRRFGWMKIIETKELKNRKTEELKNLGVDALSKEFSVHYLAEQAERFPNKKVKQFLMDQSIVGGIGNIYSDEGLFFAGIYPERKLKDIKAAEWGKIREGIVKALNLGIKHGGYSADTYVNAIGEKGEAQEYLNVYGKDGRGCKVCGSVIKKNKVGGRTSRFCPKCQC
jgi:formamidopyrimidine-DNA glycosylase